MMCAAACSCACRCPGTGYAHLVVNYLFDSMGTTLKDRSGNNHDGVVHDLKYSADYPDLSCIFHSSQMYKMMQPVAIGQHGQGLTAARHPAIAMPSHSASDSEHCCVSSGD